MTARPRSDYSGPWLDEVLATERRANVEACRRASLVVADRSADKEECRELLAMLGLIPPFGVTEAAHRP